MKQLHIWITDDQAKELDSYPRKSEEVRKALDMYIQGIATGRIDNMAVAFKGMTDNILLLNDKLDKLLTKLEEMSYR